MSLFDYISSKLSKEQKKELYKDKLVCLSIFRVAFDELEQQLIFRLVFRDAQFTQNDINEMLNIEQTPSGQQRSGQYTDQAKTDLKELSQKFVEKLKKLELSFDLLALSSSLMGTPNIPLTPLLQSSISIGSQYTYDGVGTPALQTGVSQAYQDQQDSVSNRLYKLNKDFSANVQSLLESNLELTKLKQKKIKRKKLAEAESLEQISLQQWEKTTYFMLNLINQSQINPNLINLLEKAKYIEQQLTGEYQLTVHGFKYILLDPSSQVHHIVLNYIKTAEYQGRNEVELLQLIFNLTLTEYNQCYKLKQQNENLILMIKDFAEMGLISMYGDNKFFITNLLQSFLLSQSGQSSKAQEHNKALINKTRQNEGNDKFIIVETNFKVFAYTSSKLYKALLKLFIRIDYAFPNLIVGSIARTSVQRAFNRGITAEQILNFLESHIHINTKLNRLLISQDRIQQANQGSANTSKGPVIGTSTTGGQATDFSQVKPTQDTKNISIAQLFGLSSAKQKQQLAENPGSAAEYVPPNVKQQIWLWEKELNSIEAMPGLLIEFETNMKLKNFQQFAVKQKIKIHRINEPQNLIVVDLRYEKEAYEYIQSDQ